MDVPIGMISTGPDRDQTMVLPAFAEELRHAATPLIEAPALKATRSRAARGK